MFKKILVPLDGSKNAERALPWALAYAAPRKTPVVLTRILEPIYPLRGMPFGEGSKEARAYLESIARRFAPASIPVQIALPAGPAARAIVETAVRQECDLIVISTRGNSRVVRWLVGGVTEQVMRLSPVPLLVVRCRPPEPDAAQPRRILLLLDGSTLSRQALPWAVRLARRHGAPLVLISILPEFRGSRRGTPLPEDPGTGALEALSARLRRQGIQASLQVRRGDPAEEVLRASARQDLIVLTTHGRGGLKRWILGSVAEKVIHEAAAPVFICKKFPRLLGTAGSEKDRGLPGSGAGAGIKSEWGGLKVKRKGP